MVAREPLKLVFCSPVDWWETRQRFHHIAHGLSESYAVSVFFPRSHKRILKEKSPFHLFLPYSKEQEREVALFGIPQIPFYRAHHSFVPINWKFSNLLTRSALGRKAAQTDVLWLTHPSQEGLRRSIPHRLCVYECVDDYSQFWPHEDTRRAVEEAEARLASAADLVVATSQALVDRMRAFNARCILVGNGVELEHFRKVRTEAFALPAELAQRPGAWVGFFGAIGDWVDLELVAQAAAAHPDVNFLMIGPVFTDTSALANSPNVLLTGLKSYEDLLPYLAHIPVWTLPFVQNRLTEAVDPVKIYEYLAAGRRVVSTYLPSLAPFSDALNLAASRHEFLAELKKALEDPGDFSRPADLDVRLEQRSWGHLSRTILSNLAQSHAAMTQPIQESK
ncbi:hypothetical protein J7643_15755 [bacterium]|nr:hypothetical protein [bacterium]